MALIVVVPAFVTPMALLYVAEDAVGLEPSVV